MSLKDVPDTSKASMLIPVFKQSFDTSKKDFIPPTADQEFLMAIAHAFDKNAAKALNDEEGALWQIFVEVLRTCLIRGKHRATPDLSFTNSYFGRSTLLLK